MMAGRVPRVTSAQLRRALERAGWQQVRQKGSHVHFRHPDRTGRVTISIHAGATVKPKILQSVLNQAGMTVDELREYL